MIQYDAEPEDVREENDLPFHASCGDCGHMNIQIDGAYWCSVFDDEIIVDQVCEEWAYG